jgi:hypothetical protein
VALIYRQIFQERGRPPKKTAGAGAGDLISVMLFILLDEGRKLTQLAQGAEGRGAYSNLFPAITPKSMVGMNTAAKFVRNFTHWVKPFL